MPNEATKTVSSLMQPLAWEGAALRNRVVMAPLTRGRAGEERVPNSLMAEYYRQRASAGLIIAEATSISRQGLGWIDSPGAYTDEHEAGWKLVTDAVHEAGGRIFLQLWHCGRASHTDFHPDEGLPVSASAVRLNDPEGLRTPASAGAKVPHETPRPLTENEIADVILDYRSAAERAKRAGFDGVEIHAANGYLLDQFLQSKTNRRDDAYGGSLEKRFRLLGDVVAAVKSVWPSQQVGVRISPNGAFNDMGSDDFRETFLYVAEQLASRDLAYLHVIDGLAFGFHEKGDPLTLAEIRKVYPGRVMGNCGYDQAKAEAAIEAGHADLIAFGRPFISNPDFVERVQHAWPLAETPPMDVWYSTGARGYTDFPPHQE